MEKYKKQAIIMSILLPLAMFGMQWFVFGRIEPVFISVIVLTLLFWLYCYVTVKNYEEPDKFLPPTLRPIKYDQMKIIENGFYLIKRTDGRFATSYYDAGFMEAYGTAEYYYLPKLS